MTAAWPSGPGPARERVIARIAERLLDRVVDHPLRVAVDGITAAGKTTLADELAGAIVTRGRPAVRVSMDGFHHPRAHRHRRAHSPALGYYEDAYDFASFRDAVLRPLGPGGSRRYQPAVHDLATDERLDGPPLTAADDAVLLVDGTFLQKPPLAGAWDLVVYVATSVPVAAERAAVRDAALFGGADETREAYAVRYHAACALYADEWQPVATADVVVDNDDLDRPVLLRS